MIANLLHTLIMSFIFPNVQLSYDFRPIEGFQTLENCDLHIIQYDFDPLGKSFYPLSTQQTRPIIISKIQKLRMQLRTHLPYLQQITKTRGVLYKISIIHSSYFTASSSNLPTKLVRLESWLIHTVYRYASPVDYRNPLWRMSAGSVFALIVTDMKKTKVEKFVKIYFSSHNSIRSYFLNIDVAMLLNNPKNDHADELCSVNGNIHTPISKWGCAITQHSGNILLNMINLFGTQNEWVVNTNNRLFRKPFLGVPSKIGINREEFNFHEYLVLQVFQAQNTTLNIRTHTKYYCQPRIDVRLRPDVWEQGLSWHIEFVTTHNPGFHFLTCHSEEYMTFWFYVKPFQSVLWICLCICIATLIAAIKVYERLSSQSEPPFTTWLFILANLFEEAGHVPSRLESNLYFRMILGGWILMSVLLTNFYNGIMITDLLAPYPGKTPGTFQDLLCENSKIYESYEATRKKGGDLSVWLRARGFETINTQWNESNYFRQYTTHAVRSSALDDSDKPCFSILSSLIFSFKFEFPDFLTKFRAYHFIVVEHYIKHGLPIPPKLLHIFALLLNQKIQMVPRDMHLPGQTNLTHKENIRRLIEGEIVECGKSVFVTDHSQVKLEMQYLEKYYPGIDFHVGKDLIQQGKEGYQFFNARNSKIPGCFRSLVETGIVDRLAAISYRQEFRGRQPVKKLIPRISVKVGLRSGIDTLFVLFGVLLIAAVCCFLAECRSRIVVFLKEGISKVYNLCRKTCQFLKIGNKFRQNPRYQ